MIDALPSPVTLAYALARQEICAPSIGIILSGSAMYGDYKPGVSDLDFICVYPNIKNCVPLFAENADHQQFLRRSRFDSFRKKITLNGVKLSIRGMGLNTFNAITQADVGTYLCYRTLARSNQYKHFAADFGGTVYDVERTQQLIEGQAGAFVNVPIACTLNGNYVKGADLNMLLSPNLIVHDPQGIMAAGVDAAWRNVTTMLLDYKQHRGMSPEDPSANLLNSFVRGFRYSPESREYIESKTREWVKTIAQLAF